jgi:SARP family transcriptional regulator, regulator of embCAB operon
VTAAPAPVAIGVLGPLVATVAGRPVNLAGPRQRALVALLAVLCPGVVPADRLVAEIWRDDANEASKGTLQVHVSNVRRAFREAAEAAGVPVPDVIVTKGTSYGLAPGVTIDEVEFAGDVAEGMDLVQRGEHERAAALFRRALGRWRGHHLEDVPGLVAAEVAGLRLEEQRLAVLEARVAADLACGRHAAVVPELEALTREHPVRESLWGQLMVALYRCGRQTEALRVFQRAREALADEAGVDPGPELRRLEHSILAQSPRLDAPVTGQAQLAWFDADRRLCSLRLAGRDVVRVGRRDTCDVALAWDPLVSRAHATFATSQGRWALVDDGSRNGSSVNGEPVIRPRPLADGDVCRFGSTIVLVHLAAPVPVSRAPIADGATLLSPEP